MGFPKRRKQPHFYRPHAAQIESGERIEGIPGMLGVDCESETARLNPLNASPATSIESTRHRPRPTASKPRPRSQVGKRQRGSARVVLLTAVLAVGASGCALLQDEIHKAAKGAGYLVKTYCENFPSDESRAAFANQVNGYASPHAIRVDCAEALAPPLITRGAPGTRTE